MTRRVVTSDLCPHALKQGTENDTSDIVERHSTLDKEDLAREDVTCSPPKAWQLQSTNRTARSNSGNPNTRKRRFLPKALAIRPALERSTHESGPGSLSRPQTAGNQPNAFRSISHTSQMDTGANDNPQYQGTIPSRLAYTRSTLC